MTLPARLLRFLYLLAYGMWRNECALTVERNGRVRVEVWHLRKGDPLRRVRVFYDGPGKPLWLPL